MRFEPKCVWVQRYALPIMLCCLPYSWKCKRVNTNPLGSEEPTASLHGWNGFIKAIKWSLVNDTQSYPWKEKPLSIFQTTFLLGQVAWGRWMDVSNMKIPLLTYWARALKSLWKTRTWVSVLFSLDCAGKWVNVIHTGSAMSPAIVMGHLDLNTWPWFHTGHSTELVSSRCLPRQTVTSLGPPGCVWVLFQTWIGQEANDIYCVY